MGSELDRPPGVSGRRRRYYTVLPEGLAALDETRTVRDAMWEGVSVASADGSSS